jgi:hypothetical protein
MNTEELNRLLEKYYRGESTGEEESALKAFFSGENIPEGYEADRALFSYVSEKLKIPEPSSGFEAKIVNGIDAYEINSSRHKIRRIALLGISSAAGLLLLVGSYFFFNAPNNGPDTFTDPEIAYAETVKILINVSNQLNKAARTLEPVGKMDEVKSNSIEKNLKNLEYIQAAIDLTRTSGDNK